MTTQTLAKRPVRRWLDAAAAAIAACLGFLTVGCWRGDSLPAEDPSRLTITLRSAAFSDGGLIPKAHTCDGEDRSPPLEWSGVPGTARSLALICDDPDAPMGTFSHWVLFNLPPRVQALPEGDSAAATITAPASEPGGASGAEAPRPQPGKNDFGKLGYGGPCPPSGTHRYIFRLYALDTRLGLTSSATRADVLQASRGHILAEGRLMGRYARAK
jgi:Raf kinase inhibitor-like YbhB/YbcL family protein